MTELRIDGPHSPDYTKEVAAQLAECVRVLNHATQGDDGLRNSADAYELLGELSTAAAGLPQLLQQTRAFLDRELEAGRLRDTNDGDPADAVEAAGAYVDGARKDAAELRDSCNTAQQAIANLGGKVITDYEPFVGQDGMLPVRDDSDTTDSIDRSDRDA